jgi:hypothetical protein
VCAISDYTNTDSSPDAMSNGSCNASSDGISDCISNSNADDGTHSDADDGAHIDADGGYTRADILANFDANVHANTTAYEVADRGTYKCAHR